VPTESRYKCTVFDSFESPLLVLCVVCNEYSCMKCVACCSVGQTPRTANVTCTMRWSWNEWSGQSWRFNQQRNKHSTCTDELSFLKGSRYIWANFGVLVVDNSPNELRELIESYHLIVDNWPNCEKRWAEGIRPKLSYYFQNTESYSEVSCFCYCLDSLL
jgi:hypothetical protein